MRYFQLYEFDSPDVKGSCSNMDSTMLSMIDEARAFANIPFIINSGYRTEKNNKKIGGVINSSHLKGLAVDIKCMNSVNRFIIIDSLKRAGFNRIGISETFIHADIDTDKTQNVIWVY